MTIKKFIELDTYPWPFYGSLSPDNTALIIVDMQTDFCGIGGYVDKIGDDLLLTRAPIDPIKSVLDKMQGGLFGAVSDSKQLLAALGKKS